MDTFVVGRIRGSLCLLLVEMPVYEKGCRSSCPRLKFFLLRVLIRKTRFCKPLRLTRLTLQYANHS